MQDINIFLMIIMKKIKKKAKENYFLSFYFLYIAVKKEEADASLVVPTKEGPLGFLRNTSATHYFGIISINPFRYI